MKKSANFMDRFIIKKRPNDAKQEQKLDLGPSPSAKEEGGSEQIAKKVEESETVKAMDKAFAERKDWSPAQLKR